MSRTTHILKSTKRAKGNASRHFLSSKKLFLRYRKSAVPEGGWTHENFTGQARDDLRADMLTLRRAAILRGLRTLSPSLQKIMEDQVNRVIETALNGFARLYGIPRKSFDTKEDFDFVVPNHASMWADAIEQEMSRAGVEITVAMTPPMQSVGGDVFEKVNLSLGHKPTSAQVNSLGTRMRTVASKVGGISDTTRERLVRYVGQSIKEGATVFETAEKLRQKMPSLAANRVPTIVRTELGNAADEAVKHAMKVSGVVTHFDVIGCEGIEPNIPTFRGTPTCNIRGVPIQYENEIRFHPNHTGAIVAGAFRQEDGNIPAVNLVGGVGEGTPIGG